MSNSVPALQVCRGLLREIARATKAKPTNQTSWYKYAINKYRSNHTTTSRFCRAQYEANHDAATYWCLLRSLREQKNLIEKYHGLGDVDIKKAANTVGLNLPKEYQPEQNVTSNESEDQEKP